MKKIILVAVVAALCATSCTRSMKGYVSGRNIYSISIVDEEGKTVDFATVKTAAEDLGDVIVNDFVNIKYNTLKTKDGKFRSVKKIQSLVPCFTRRIAGRWSVGSSGTACFEFISGGFAKVSGIDVSFTKWNIAEKPGETPVLNLITNVFGENGISDEVSSYGFTLSEDGNALIITDKETGETVWDLTRVQE